MKSLRLTAISLTLFVLCNVLSSNSKAQTAGTFTFTINPIAHSGSYGAKHVAAIWIENSTGTFIKTKLRQSSGSTIDHLGTWTSKSSSNVVDATTGSTLTTYTPITVKWDGTNVSKAVVADGDYKVWIEMAWDNSKTSAKTVTSFTFTKGPSTAHLTSANTSLFTDIVLDWIPLATGIETISQTNKVSVFPNPTNGLINLDLKLAASACSIQIANTTGTIIYEEKVAKGTVGVKSVDLSKYPNGIYLINILQASKANNLQFKVLLHK